MTTKPLDLDGLLAELNDLEPKRRIKRQQPELFARITSLPNAVRSAKRLASAGVPPAAAGVLPGVSATTTSSRRDAASSTRDACAPPVVFFFGQAGDFQRLWLADAEGNILAEDNHSSIAAITCPLTEKRQPLPAHHNALVTALKSGANGRD